jgi:hypothetical protein
MPKKTSVSAFDDIISQFGDDEDKSTFLGLAEKHPFIKEYGMRQSDYSRQLNENKEKLALADEWNGWKSNHWDDEAQMTKQQKAAVDEAARLKQEKEDLESRIAVMGSGGDEVTFEELEKFGTKLMSEKGLITKADMDAKEAELKGYVTGVNGFMTKAAVTVPYLNAKHQQEFGEMFDPDDFIKVATEKQRYDLKDFYEKDYVVEKRQANIEARHKAAIDKVNADAEVKITEANKRAEEIAARVAGMGAGGMNPSDDGGSAMGGFQKRYLELDKAEATNTAPEVPLGQGAVAAFAAAKWRQDQLASRS